MPKGWKLDMIPFNEAPIHESGKLPSGESYCERLCAFNEAPIHESGKWRVHSRNRLRIHPFNEAPIHESGKFLDSAAAAFGGEPSMRPRFMNRGSGVRSRERMQPKAAFNEAPIHESGK